MIIFPTVKEEFKTTINIMSLFVRKPMSALVNEAQETGTHTLKRTLGAGGLVALGIGAIIGAGLFSITGMAAANHAGPAITLSFIVAGLSCLFAGIVRYIGIVVIIINIFPSQEDKGEHHSYF